MQAACRAHLGGVVQPQAGRDGAECIHVQVIGLAAIMYTDAGARRAVGQTMQQYDCCYGTSRRPGQGCIRICSIPSDNPFPAMRAASVHYQMSARALPPFPLAAPSHPHARTRTPTPAISTITTPPPSCPANDATCRCRYAESHAPHQTQTWLRTCPGPTASGPATWRAQPASSSDMWALRMCGQAAITSTSDMACLWCGALSLFACLIRPRPKINFFFRPGPPPVRPSACRARPHHQPLSNDTCIRQSTSMYDASSPTTDCGQRAHLHGAPYSQP